MKLFFLFLFLIFSLNLSAQLPENYKELLLLAPENGNEGKYMEVIYELAPNDEAFVALIRLLEPHLDNKDWESALNIINSFKDYFPERQAHLDKMIEIIQRENEDLEELNIGSGVNSSVSEIAPIQTADENTLYFTSVKRDGFDNETDDIFYSTRSNGIWSPAKKLEAPFNTPTTEESPQGITTDGNTMVLFGNYQEKPGGGDLYYAEKTAYGWTEAIQYPEGINSEYFDCDGKLTNDGKALIFVSDRPGGIGPHVRFNSLHNGSLYGNTDIYVALKTESGWTQPINLGNIINTPGAERKPFLHPDGKTLYFSSNGHPGLGRQDLFVSKRLDPDDWTKWSEPINLGKEINTPDNERGANISTEGGLAFFASADRRLNFGASDVYTMELPEKLRPEPVTSISGKVTNANGFPLEAEIVWEDLETGKELGRLKSDPKTGAFFIVLPHGINYGLYANKEDFFPLSENFDTRNITKSRKINKDIVLTSILDLLGDDLELGGSTDLLYDAFELQKKKKIEIKNLFFDYNKSNILKESFPELDRVSFLLKNYPIHLVEVAGHTDSIGNESYNQKLSEKRSSSVKDYLIRKGIEPEKIVIKGYGPSDPVADNSTEEGRAKNRRVELVILKAGRAVEQIKE